MWQLTCSFQDELKSVKLLADDAWQVAIGYSSDSSDLKKIQLLFTSLLSVNPLPRKKALTLSHGQRFHNLRTGTIDIITTDSVYLSIKTVE